MQKKKKGFTLVELLVVIAILAILASVSVVGYLSFTKKANQSADEQAVTQMNTVLEAVNVNDKVDDIIQVFSILGEQGLSAKDYKPLTANTAFYWYKDENKIIILDENTKKIIYPEKLQNVDYGQGNLFALTGTVEKDPNFSTTPNTQGKVETATVTSGNQLLAVIEQIEKEPNKYADNVNINISNDIDLMGSNEAALNISNIKNLKNITISGTPQTKNANGLKSKASNGNPTISCMVNVTSKYKSVDGAGNVWHYSTGLIGLVQNQNVTFENINFDNITSYGETKMIDNVQHAFLGVGGLIGEVKGNSTVKFNNVHITNANVYSAQFSGGFIGRVLFSEGEIDSKGDTKIIFENCSIKNSKIGAELGQNAGLVGAINELNNWGEEKINPNTAINRIKENIVVSNVEVGEDVELYIDGIETVTCKITKNDLIKHNNDEYTVNSDLEIHAGVYYINDKKENVEFNWLFTYAKLFNINPTFNHGADSSTADNVICNGLPVRFNNALIGIDNMSDLDKLVFTKLS